MDLVLRQFEKANFLSLIRTFSIPVGIIILITMMVIPLSPWLLDILLTSNLLISLLVLMVALQAFRPLRFFKFSNSITICHCFEIRTKCGINQSYLKKRSFRGQIQLEE